MLARLKTTSYDVIVLSCGMEGSPADDFAFLREVRLACPDTPVVVFTDATHAHTLAETQRAGAAGLVSMHEGAGEFERVCKRVLSGARGIVSPLRRLPPPRTTRQFRSCAQIRGYHRALEPIECLLPPFQYQKRFDHHQIVFQAIVHYRGGFDLFNQRVNPNRALFVAQKRRVELLLQTLNGADEVILIHAAGISERGLQARLS